MLGQVGALVQDSTVDANLYDYIAFGGAAANEVHLKFDGSQAAFLQATPIDTAGDANCSDDFLADNITAGSDGFNETCRIHGTSCVAGVCTFDVKYANYATAANHDGRIKIDFRVDATDNNDDTDAASSVFMTKRNQISEIFGITSPVEPFGGFSGGDAAIRSGRLEVYAKASPEVTNETINGLPKNTPIFITIGESAGSFDVEYVYDDPTIIADNSSLTRSVTIGTLTGGSVASTTYPNGPGSINLEVTPDNGVNTVTIPYSVNIWGVSNSGTITVNLDNMVTVDTNNAVGNVSESINFPTTTTLAAGDMTISAGTVLNGIEFIDVNAGGTRITGAGCTNAPYSCSFTYNYQDDDYVTDNIQYRILYTTAAGVSSASDWYTGDYTLNNTAPIAYTMPLKSAYQGTTMTIAITQHPFNGGNAPGANNGYGYWDKQMDPLDSLTITAQPANTTLVPLGPNFACGSATCLFSVDHDFGFAPTGNIDFTVTAAGQTSNTGTVPIAFSEMFEIDPWTGNKTYDRQFTVDIAKVASPATNGDYATGNNLDADEIIISNVVGGLLVSNGGTADTLACTAGDCSFDIDPTAGNKTTVTFDYALRYNGGPVITSATTTGTVTMLSNDAVINTQERVVNCATRTACSTVFDNGVDYTDADGDKATNWANMKIRGGTNQAIVCDGNGDCTVTADFGDWEYNEMSIKFNYVISSPKGTNETPTATNENVYLTFRYTGADSVFGQTITDVKLNRQCNAVIKGSTNAINCGGGTCQAAAGSIYNHDLTTNIATGSHLLYDYVDSTGTARAHENFGIELVAGAGVWDLIGDNDGDDTKSLYRFSWQISDGTNTRKESLYRYVEKQTNTGSQWEAFPDTEVPTWYASGTHQSVYNEGMQSPYDACEANGACTGYDSSISVARSHVCYVNKNRNVNCWGRDGAGQLGNSSPEDNAGGTHQDGLNVVAWNSGGDKLPDITQVSVSHIDENYSGGSFTHWGISCAIRTNGAIWCWGDNWDGMVGANIGTNNWHQPYARKVQYEDDNGDPYPLYGTSVSTGPYMVCALSDTHADGAGNPGAVWCWGRHITQDNNGYAKYSINSKGNIARQMKFSNDVESNGFIGISVGGAHVCGLRREVVLGINKNRIYCLGGNKGSNNLKFDQARASIVTTADVDFTEKFGLMHSTFFDNKDVRKVVAGFAGNCAITGSGDQTNGEGAVYCWGWQDKSELGQGSDGIHSTPKHITGTGSKNTYTIVDMSMDAEINCMISNDRKMYCVGEQHDGNNDKTEGMLNIGNASNATQNTLVEAQGYNYTAVSVGRGIGCAMAAGSLWCWGSAKSGYNNYALGRGQSQTIHTSVKQVNIIDYGNNAQAPAYRTCTEHLIINPTYP
jgi:alpha-tubulin suppressor-like RCC1 family protein